MNDRAVYQVAFCLFIALAQAGCASKYKAIEGESSSLIEPDSAISQESRVMSSSKRMLFETFGSSPNQIVKCMPSTLNMNQDKTVLKAKASAKWLKRARGSRLVASQLMVTNGDQSELKSRIQSSSSGVVPQCEIIKLEYFDNEIVPLICALVAFHKE
mgnify:CR=1 FL=1